MGVLDKYRFRGNRGQVPVKGLFNPGRNQNWDWNELLQTIENNFSTDDSDLAALTARVATSEGLISTLESGQATNASAITATNSALEALTSLTTEMGLQVGLNKTDNGLIRAQIAAICVCLENAEIACPNCGKDPAEARR